MKPDGFARLELERGAGRVDQLAPLRRVGLAQQPLERNRDEVHVAEILLAVAHRQLHGFRGSVNVVGAVEPHLREVEALEHVEREELGRALIGRRVLVDLVAAIIRRDRRLDFRRVAGEVLVAEQRRPAARRTRPSSARCRLCRSDRARRSDGRAGPVAAPFFRLDQLAEQTAGVGILEEVARRRTAGRPAGTASRSSGISPARATPSTAPARRRARSPARQSRWRAGAPARTSSCPSDRAGSTTHRSTPGTVPASSPSLSGSLLSLFFWYHSIVASFGAGPPALIDDTFFVFAS